MNRVEKRNNNMKRLLLSLIGITAITLDINALVYTHVFKSGDLGTKGSTTNLSGFEWTASDANFITWTAEREALQFGSKDKGACEKYSLTSSAFAEFTIKEVIVHTSRAGSGDAKLVIKAGIVSSDTIKINDTMTSYSLACKTNGDISLNWEATKRAFYISSIEIVYELPEHMVDVEEARFKAFDVYDLETGELTTEGAIIPEDIFADKKLITAETADKDIVLYYTTDGTDPSYEDYLNETGTTHCSKGYQMNHEITETTTIKILAVKVDGEMSYKSDIVERTFYVSPTKPYTTATEIVSENRYALMACDSIANALLPQTENGYLEGRMTTKYEKYTDAVAYCAFTFKEVQGGYTIQDSEGRYMIIHGNQFSFVKEMPKNGAVWTITFNGEKAEIKNGNYTIYYSAENDRFGCYTADEVSNDMEQPSLGMLCEYPEYTITPGENSSFEYGKKFVMTITCEDGVAASEDLIVKVSSDNISEILTCIQKDDNTIELVSENELKTTDNIDIGVSIEQGDIFLAPDGIKMKIRTKQTKLYGNRTLMNTYKLLGNAPAAEIKRVRPTDGSELEELSYILFTFSNIVTGVSTDEAKAVRLHLEGSDEMIPVEYTNMQENGTSPVDMKQGALKMTTPVIKNGTYILEIPDGFFIDRNDHDVKGRTLKYIVKNNYTDIDSIIENETKWVVYSIGGTKLLDTTEKGDFELLPKGIYIVNGKKTLCN